MNGFRWLMVLAIISSLAGCSRKVDPEWSLSKGTLELEDPKLREQIAAFLLKECGSYRQPKLFGSPDLPLERLKAGQAVYMKRCVQCHGASGAGDGPVAEYLNPKPRDYRQGIFKFGSTPYGSKPRREDLVRTVERGITGTSMPSFRLLTKTEISDVVDYILAMSHRGELEYQLYNEAKDAGELTEDSFLAAKHLIRARWTAARQQEVIPLTREPVFTEEMVNLGKEAFLTKGCAQCHGADGRGNRAQEVNLDTWGQPSLAADLTSGMLRGGSKPIDIYRRIYGGVNGTRMPGFADSFSSEPDTLWNLVAFVMHVSNRRREGEIPPAELLSTPAPNPDAE